MPKASTLAVMAAVALAVVFAHDKYAKTRKA